MSEGPHPDHRRPLLRSDARAVPALPKGEGTGVNDSPHPNPLRAPTEGWSGGGTSDNGAGAGPVLEAKGFSISLGGKDILHSVSFSVRRGEYVAVVGPNGAGKTTLLKCFDRLLAGGSGELAIEGRPRDAYRQKDLARLVAYVPQADSRMIPFSVEQFLLMCRYPYLSPFSPASRRDRQAINEAMSLTKTTEFAGRKLSTLSGGERQKVHIAAALAQGAHIWLLDEPTTFLDYHRQNEIIALLASVNKELGVTILSVTHDLNHAVLETDRVVALKDGRVVFNGPPGEIMQADVLERIYDTPVLLVEHPGKKIPMIVPRGANPGAER
jgi:iron complex transport system ATP-binding protein